MSDELAGLPEDVQRIMRELDKHERPELSRKNWDIIRAELVRPAREIANLRNELELAVDECQIHEDACDAAEAELAAARETIKRLNRRVQVAEAGIAEKVKASAPGSFGRGLANAAADMFMHERDEARAELAALKRRIAEAPTTTPVAMQTITPAGMQATVPLGNTDGCFAYVPPWLCGQRVALLPVGGE